MFRQLELSQKTVTYAESEDSHNFSRILCAAVVNKGFRNQLLVAPAETVAAGYCGESFHMREDEKRILGSIRATNLADFAAQLMQTPEPVSLPLSYVTLD